MKGFRKWLGAAAAAWVAVATFLLISCGTVSRTVMVPAQIEGATYVGNQVCADCHANITKVFPGSPHARVHVDVPGTASLTSCESCHGPASKHVAAGRGHIINPRKNPESCFNCHLGVHAEFRLPNHHPVIEGHMNCVQCHDPHGHDITKPAGGLAMALLNESCAQCHREQARLFVFEHEALRDGCVTCHNPHGSINSKLLTQRDPNLCLKCHAQRPGGGGSILIGDEDHTFHLRQGTCWSAGCHTAVHGSNISPKLRY